MIDSGLAGSTYVIELGRWQISDNGSDPANTTSGINAALVWAGSNGYSRCKLPAGVYTVDKDSQIEMVSNMTLDLYGCTIVKETNGYQSYMTVSIKNQTNSAIVGGVIVGDRDSHDYTTTPGTHEWGMGIAITSSRGVVIDQVEIKETTGYGISIGSTYNHSYWVYLADMEAGTLNASGQPVANASWVRTKKMYSLSEPKLQQQGFFMVCGNGYGSFGTGFDLSKSLVTAYFYNDQNAYLGKMTRRTYEPFVQAYFPAGTTQFKLSFRADMASITDSSTTIRCDAVAQDIFVTSCFIHDCRTLGMACGGQRITVDHCEISGIGGAAPGFGIDIEDGYHLNQHITISNTAFHDNLRGDVVAISARGVLLEQNRFSGMVSLSGARGENYVSQYNEYNGTMGNGTTLSGGNGTYCVFRYDHFTGGQAFLTGNELYEHSVFDDSTFILQSDNYLTTTFRNCRFFFNQPDQGWAWNLRKGSIVFDSCELQFNCQYYYFYNEGHFGDPTRNNMTMRGCTVNASVPLGGYKVNILLLEGNSFQGTADKNYDHLDMMANQAIIRNNRLDNFNMTMNGVVGTDPGLIMKGNTITLHKPVPNYGPERNEGIYIRKFDNVYIEGNIINATNPGVYPFRMVTVYGEKLLKMTDNVVASSGGSAKVELYGAYRANGDTAAVPALTALIWDNVARNAAETKDTTFLNQVVKTIGNGTASI